MSNKRMDKRAAWDEEIINSYTGQLRELEERGQGNGKTAELLRNLIDVKSKLIKRSGKND